ncbi:MAG: hypothetical protein ACOC5T_00395 [Elusimicrobiota bacterium]
MGYIKKVLKDIGIKTEDIAEILEEFDKNSNLKKSFESIISLLLDLEDALEEGEYKFVKENIKKAVDLTKTYFEEYGETEGESPYFYSHIHLVSKLTYIIHSYILGCTVEQYKDMITYKEDRWYNNG